jgi:hypothetical protein
VWEQEISGDKATVSTPSILMVATLIANRPTGSIKLIASSTTKKKNLSTADQLKELKEQRVEMQIRAQIEETRRREQEAQDRQRDLEDRRREQEDRRREREEDRQRIRDKRESTRSYH